MDPLSNEYISRLLRQSATYGDNSLLDDWRNARSMRNELDKLNRQYDFVDGTYYDKVSSGLRNQQGTALAGMALSGLNGVTGLVSNAIQGAQTQDTSSYENQLQDYVDYSNYNYTNYDQLANDMSQNYLGSMPSYEDIRGMNGWQKAGNIGTSTLQGAQAGFQIGGPVGAAIGGAAGLIASGIGVLTGDRNAKRKEQQLKTQTILAQDTANQNFEAAHERIGDYQNRRGVVNSVARGGQIERYIGKNLKPSHRKEQNVSGVTRIRKDGGCVYRVRIK